MTSTTTKPDATDVLAGCAHRLLCASAVRQRAQRMLGLGLDGRLDDWEVDLDQMETAADLVASVVRERYPHLIVPLHSRWRHFTFAGRNLWQPIAAGAHWNNPEAEARAAFDLVIVSVLLDAGAGSAWSYHDRATGLTTSRSEGLALASLRWFENGGLSDDSRDPLRVDAAVLRRLDLQAIEAAFQVVGGNEMLGLPERAALLNRLGIELQAKPELFAISDSPRPGGLFDALRMRGVKGQLPAAAILETLLEALGPIWRNRPVLGGVALGDCWPHPSLVGSSPEEGYAPFHKLSQWLAYSLIEPLQRAGIRVCDVQELTGLAEYRNGGLLVDIGVLRPRDRTQLLRTYAVSDPFVVAWRALTVALLDRLAPPVRSRLGLAPEHFPLASLLEGGSWAAGRLIARRLRADGGPPFQVLTDGTVF